MSLREYHKTTGNKQQSIKVGEVVTVHDDIPRVHWKLAVVEKLITGLDGYSRAGEIRTATENTNRSIAKRIPLVVTEEISNPTVSDSRATQEHNTTTDIVQRQLGRPTRQATVTARRRLREWSNIIRAALEDVIDCEQ